ncbi:MAG TPA: hypothetical protein VKV39_08700 [Candidatus Sulfotelmatobacter sp.]|nr:hypothetical protein [Candidatus Sulfotelmatobacter sp.]
MQGLLATTLPPRNSEFSAPSLPIDRGAKAAREFESQLIGSLLESLEKTFAAVPGGESMPGADDYNYLGIQALSTALVEKGGFGIANMISRSLARSSHDGETQTSVSNK